MQELIRSARKKDAAAQRALFDGLAPKMMMICRRYVKSPLDAEERMLDGFVKFFNSLNSFTYQNEAALFAWVKRIMVNECLMFLRKRNLFTTDSEEFSGEILVREDVLDHIATEEIFKMIIQLPAGYRTVFNLYVVEGLSHAEIATALGITEGTSKSQLSKARVMLQKLIILNNPGHVASR